MNDFRIEQEFRGTVGVVRLTGALDMYSLPRLGTQLSALFQQQHFNVLLDCEDLHYIASAGLGALIGFAKRFRDMGGDLKLVNVPGSVYQIIELLGFTKVLRVYNQEEEALASFDKKCQPSVN